MNTQLHKILAFAQKTGDKVIVTDPEGKEPLVVMPFNMYEHLIEIGKKSSGLGAFPVVAEDEIDALAGAPDELFAPTAPDVDDLALEVPKTAPKPVPKVVPEPVVTPIETKDTQKEPTLAKNEQGDDLPDEQEFYLEPVS